MRKHPDAIALIAIGFTLFASMGFEGAARRVEQENFRVRPLILQGERMNGAAVRDTVRAIVREALSHR